MSSEVGKIVNAAMQGMVEQSTNEIGIQQQNPNILILHQ
jgi:hypothetical protein